MVTPETMIGSIIAAVFASTGFWTFLQFIVAKRSQKDSAQSKMLKGLAHDRICELGEEYIQRGSITKDEIENLYDYLYLPYHELGGNGTAEKIVNDVMELPLKEKE